MRIVVALGGNALLRRGEPLTAEAQRRNARLAAEALCPLAARHDLVITHGNGPQVGLLALQSAAAAPGAAFPLDVLDAETAGQIGYMVEQELVNLLPAERHCAMLLTQVEVDPADPAFAKPSKPIGPLYEREEAEALAASRGWRIAPDGRHFRRVVASPQPQRIVELEVLELLLARQVVVVCLGGGGIPVVRSSKGRLEGVEAVIDKDLASSLLARRLKADALLMLTDVEAVFTGWDTPDARPLRRISSAAIAPLPFESGTMAPKVMAARQFCDATDGIAGIGRLADAGAILKGELGTHITAKAVETAWW